MYDYGLVGGLGALSSALLYSKIVETSAANGASVDEDFPSILISSKAITNFDELGVLKEEHLSELKEISHIFGKANVVDAWIVCNSLSSTIPILNSHSEENNYSTVWHRLTDLVKAYLLQDSEVYNHNSKVLALSSEGSRDLKLWHDTRYRSVELSAVEQQQITAAISEGMRSYLVDKHINTIVDIVGKHQPTHVILGCTELSPYYDRLQERHPDIKIIDSLNVLTARITEDKDKNEIHS